MGGVFCEMEIRDAHRRLAEHTFVLRRRERSQQWQPRSRFQNAWRMVRLDDYADKWVFRLLKGNRSTVEAQSGLDGLYLRMAISDAKKGNMDVTRHLVWIRINAS